MKPEAWDAARASIEIEAKAVLDVLDYLDQEAFAKAVDVIAGAERVITCASGSSGAATMKLAHSLRCI